MNDLGRFLRESMRRRLRSLEDDMDEFAELGEPISTEEERSEVLRRLRRLEAQVSSIRGEGP